jgi:GAF domain-containing protein
VTPERRALAELDSLRDSTLSHAARLETALVIICKALNVALAKILGLNDSGNELVVRSGVGWRDGVVGYATVPATTTSAGGYALGQRRAVVFNDIQGTARFTDATLLRSHNVRSSIAVRIAVEDRSIGVLSVHELSTREFSDRDAAFIEQAAPIIAQWMVRQR